MKKNNLNLFFILFLLSFFPIKFSYAEEPKEDCMADLTSNQNSGLEKKTEEQKRLRKIPDFILLEDVNYILPYYYTTSPYTAIYQNNTPNDQPIQNTEFKARLSISSIFFHDIFNVSDLNLNLSYNQDLFWQLYTESPYFREVNYEPRVFLNYHPYKNWIFNTGVDHQSNGRGGNFERSWNRAYMQIKTGGENWYLRIMGWGVIFYNQTAAYDNPDIEKYLGHDNILFSYKILKSEISLEVQNLESLMQRGFVVASFSIPLNERINLYAQYFNGYGQSLIEYDHYTSAYAVGFSFNSNN